MKNVTLQGWRGIDTKSAPESLLSVPVKDAPLVDLLEAVNVDIDDSGNLRRRDGQTIKVAGQGVHSLWASGDLCLYMIGGELFRLNTDYTSSSLALGFSGQPMSYIEIDDVVYCTDAFGCVAVKNGVARGWGIPVSEADVTGSAAGGNMERGIYLFAMTLVREDGLESGTGLAKRIDLNDNGGIVFSWAIPSDPWIAEVNLYLTQPNGEKLMLAATANVMDGSYLYTGGQRSLELATQWLDAVPSGQALVLYRGRIYIAKGDLIYATAALGYEYCDRRDYRAIDGTEVRMMAAVQGGLWIGTKNGVYFMSGQDFKTNSLDKKISAGVIKGSLVMADGQVVTGNQQLAGMLVALFATEQGVVIGLPDGSMQQMTVDRFTMLAADSGAAVLRTGITTQYLLSL
jgi:hypothetical protein